MVNLNLVCFDFNSWLYETKLTLHLFNHQDAGIVGLTPQERMKVRMHEKAKKKTAEKYSVQQLLEKVTLISTTKA